MGNRKEGNFQYNEQFGMQFDHFLVYVESVYPLEEVVLDGPGDSSKGLAHGGLCWPITRAG